MRRGRVYTIRKRQQDDDDSLLVNERETYPKTCLSRSSVYSCVLEIFPLQLGI